MQINGDNIVSFNSRNSSPEGSQKDPERGGGDANQTRKDNILQFVFVVERGLPEIGQGESVEFD